MAFSIEFDTRELERNLPRGAPEAVVYNTKQTRNGRSLFKLIDEGRGMVCPRRAKALRIPIAGVQYIASERGTKAGLFRHFARPARGLHLTEKAISQMRTAAPGAFRVFDLSHRGLVEFINAIARVGLHKLQQTTPRGGGPGKRLADSYTFKEAK